MHWLRKLNVLEVCTTTTDDKGAWNSVIPRNLHSGISKMSLQQPKDQPFIKKKAWSPQTSQTNNYENDNDERDEKIENVVVTASICKIYVSQR